MSTGTASRYIGLMSGTSLDGVDGVICEFSQDRPHRVTAFASLDFPASLRAELLALNTPGDNELHRAALAANALSRVYAQVVQALLSQGGLARADIRAIGAHGQTVRHRPGAFDGTGYTLQLQNPALLAERTGIEVVADFRSRDVAAGGQGAPLVPAFHLDWFGGSGRDIALLNLGGIGNLSLLPAGGGASGFDCGPANALLDHWCQRHTGRNYDADGAWGAGGRIVPALLESLLQEPFFSQPAPKSTGRDLFNPGWLDARLGSFMDAAPVDVQATLAALTVQAAAQALLGAAPGTQALYVCGGGTLNGALMQGLAQALPGIEVASTEALGLPPQQVEAAAFAWLARRCVERLPGNLPAATGAAGPRVLGAIYPA
ncbi:anhydro-N-acetylmuramic acid kinase [Xylophilus rhododendri]|uniref:Anhydro-N-acetylmuramic acid kinase n=1 Tax=Xylophilus rhododendri TaxID=2697032 RepID=A0A857J935_9BURK|nr:anhydro-N-acetylmuramic acid kinase [Xylophilus rhododendri]QHI99611.1 anhydro-N-acetylmuramic acid kinase [Xylophilus rhododendri]